MTSMSQIIVRACTVFAILLFLRQDSLTQNAASGKGTQQQDITGLVKQDLSSVVLVEVRNVSDKTLKIGSGFIVSSDGRIITNYHVVKGGHSAYVKLSNGAFFKVDGTIGIDEDADLAVLKVNGSNLPVLNFADSDKVAVGETVVAIGSPLGLENSVSNGIVSGIREESGKKWIQTTAAASPGNSGGPLINLSGEVVGVVTRKLAAGENLNFAVPANSIKGLLAFAGSTIKPIDSRDARNFRFIIGQSIYIAVSNLELQRKASDQFSADHRFKVAQGLGGADLVFVCILDGVDEFAMVVLPDDYSEYRTDLDGLRDHAVWQAGGQLHGFGSEVKRLVRQFEHEVLEPSNSN